MKKVHLIFIFLFILQGCSLLSEKSGLEDVEFINSSAQNTPLPSFEFVLKNHGDQDLEISYDISFVDEKTDKYFLENDLFNLKVLGGLPSDKIKSHDEKSYGATLDEEIPDEILDNMGSFDLILYQYENGKQIDKRTVEIRE